MRQTFSMLVVLNLACGGPVRLAPSLAAGAVDRTEAADAGPTSAPTRVDGGVDCNPTVATDCCDGDTRLTSAVCGDDGRYVCLQGKTCACFGKPQQFMCSDFCGSDIIQPPTCFAEGFGCPQGMVRTDACPVDTCWGEPGECCLNPRCEAGVWKCEAVGPGCG